MKLSISVPDQLWEEAQAADDRNPSQLVQEALRRLVEEAQAVPAYAKEPPVDDKEAMAAIASRLTEEAGAEFLRGYRAAVDAGKELPWFLLEQLAEDYGFNVKRWAAGFRSWIEMKIMKQLPPDVDGPDPKVTRALQAALGAHVSPFDSAEFSPNATYIRGFERAMRDLWKSVTSPQNDHDYLEVQVAAAQEREARIRVSLDAAAMAEAALRGEVEPTHR